MPSYYAVVQYVPDPVADERMNIGVIAFNDDRVYSRFIRDWQRVRSFGAKDAALLQDFARSVQSVTGQQRTLAALLEGEPFTPDAIRMIARRWKSSIRLTEPRASLLTAAELLEDIAGRFLRESKRRGGGPKSAAEILERRFRPLLDRKILAKDHPIEGSRTGIERRVDFFADSGANLALDTLRLVLTKPKEIIARADAEAFKIEDILGDSNAMRVIVYPELSLDERLSVVNDDAQRILKSVGATVETDLNAAAARLESVVGGAAGEGRRGAR